ncbi:MULTISPECIES: OsmC family protein [Catenuloplanes]|uniref:OsmC-like protein n=1 Tax=Catenuloplanes niger TaxID=587534 RepID=A0AAE3ZYN2_9ACTN|nr:OsmC family protein [Catenuloplanes niger]MDR7327654.1 putative OsmC-like protein [Catenuloplanes niger]
MSVNMVEVGHVDADVYDIRVRDHLLSVDQPVEAGGSDKAPTPVELFVASLASCVAFYAGRYLHRHGIDRTGLRVHAEYDLATDRPARVVSLRITIRPPDGFPAERVAALTAVAAHCTVHNTLTVPPDVSIVVG